MKQSKTIYSRVIRQAFSTYLEQRFFQMSVVYIASIAVLTVSAAALVGAFFEAAVTGALVMFVVFACLLVLFGEALDRAIQIQVQSALKVIDECFKCLPNHQQPSALKYMTGLTKQEVKETINVDLFGQMTIRFKVEDNQLAMEEAN